jgi:hypothetical protein
MKHCQVPTELRQSAWHPTDEDADGLTADDLINRKDLNRRLKTVV